MVCRFFLEIVLFTLLVFCFCFWRVLNLYCLWVYDKSLFQKFLTIIIEVFLFSPVTLEDCVYSTILFTFKPLVFSRNLIIFTISSLFFKLSFHFLFWLIQRVFHFISLYLSSPCFDFLNLLVRPSRSYNWKGLSPFSWSLPSCQIWYPYILKLFFIFYFNFSFLSHLYSFTPVTHIWSNDVALKPKINYDKRRRG